MNDGWKPRQHDHIVEPMFGGLDVQPECKPTRRRWWIAAGMLAALALVVWIVVALS